LPVVSLSEKVDLPPEVVYAKVADMESYPTFMRTVRSLTVLQREEGRTITRWEADLKGTTFRWEEEDTFFPEERRIAYRLVKGDLRKFEGEWRVEPEGAGSRVTLTVDFDFGIPMLAQLLNPIATLLIRQNVEAMLRGLQESLTGR